MTTQIIPKKRGRKKKPLDQFKGYWQAEFNSPFLANNGLGKEGDYYINISSGLHGVNFGGGIIFFRFHDKVVCSKYLWENGGLAE